jgi:hypothetical protein
VPAEKEKAMTAKPLPVVAPCPWCGVEPVMVSNEDLGWSLDCPDQDALSHTAGGPVRETKREAIEGWNKGAKR